jgi:hypothetical protein
MLAAALIVAVARSPAATGASGRYANPQLLAETEELAR